MSLSKYSVSELEEELKKRRAANEHRPHLRSQVVWDGKRVVDSCHQFLDKVERGNKIEFTHDEFAALIANVFEMLYGQGINEWIVLYSNSE